MIKKKPITWAKKAFRMTICMVILALTIKTLAEFSALVANTNEEALLEIDISTGEKIGHRIYGNECSHRTENLLYWSKKEEFPSLGIGHFIWLPKDSTATYEETFPQFIRFLQSQYYPVPEWLKSIPQCPWKTRDEFYAALQNGDAKMHELKNLILDTISQQGQFIVHRFHIIYEEVLSRLKGKPLAQLALRKMTQSPHGIYALVDYTNFKGSGLNPGDRRNGQGWGLLQVIERMTQKTQWVQNPEQAFSVSAIELLTERANNSPKGNEKHFLPGWISRCQTYTQKF